jgi:hypothetical protein
MQIDIPCLAAARLADVSLGGWFMLRRNGNPIYAFKVSDGQDDAAVVFEVMRNQRGIPWLSTGGFRNNTLVSLPNVVVRADPALADPDTEITFGRIMICGDDFYMRVADGPIDIRTFNMKTGVMERTPENFRPLVISVWQMGYLRDMEFNPLLSFPIS